MSTKLDDSVYAARVRARNKARNLKMIETQKAKGNALVQVWISNQNRDRVAEIAEQQQKTLGQIIDQAISTFNPTS